MDGYTCGTADRTRCSDSVVVWRMQDGANDVYLIAFRGELTGVAVDLVAVGDGAEAVDLLRMDGLTYTGLETLDIHRGSGADVLNVRGTVPVTNLFLGAGDDRVYVSSAADVGLNGRPDYLVGHLDDVDGELNIDAGAGRHTLFVSDEASWVGDEATVTREGAWLRMAGFAEGDITYTTSGSFADGIRMWTGFGDDTVLVDATYRTAGVRTVTWLSTGLGDDDVTVDLHTGADDFFVLNTQGAYQDVLDLLTDLWAGDGPIPADGVRVFLVRDGVRTALSADEFFVNYDLDTIGLLFTPRPGDRLVVEITRTTGAVQDDEVVLTPLPVVEEEHTGPQLDWSDADTVLGATSTLPLIVFGGQDADSIVTGSGADIVFGDRGRIDYEGVAGARTFLGTGGPGERTDGTVAPVISAWTVDPTVGGADGIITGGGNDLVLGGAAGDGVLTGAGDDVVLGDHGVLTYLAGVLQQLLPLANAIGGHDVVFTGAGEDVVLGGTGSDAIDAGADRDLVLGDNAELLRKGDATSLRFRMLTGQQIYGTALVEAGNALVGSAGQLNPDGYGWWASYTLTILDHSFGTATDRYGDDQLAGGADDDMLFGQLGDDTIQGDGSLQLVVRDDEGVLQLLVDAYRVRKTDGTLETLQLVPSQDAQTDGDDYVEGGGGADAIFGNLGQDDLIGGSSSFFGLTDRSQRPDVSDVIFGGSGLHVSRNNGDLVVGDGHVRDADTIVGDNGEIYRLVGGAGTTYGYLSFTYDNGYTKDRGRELVVRAVELLDYTPGGPDLESSALTSDIWGDDEVHGETGDDTVYLGAGNDIAFGDSGDDDIVGGWGHDWVSGGTGTDGVLGDDGRISTSRNGSTEPLDRAHRGTPAVGDHDAGAHPGGRDQPERAAGQDRRPDPLRPGPERVHPLHDAADALRRPLRQRRGLRWLGQRLPPRWGGQRRPLRFRGTRGHPRRDVRLRHDAQRCGPHRLGHALQRRQAARLRRRQRRLRPLRRVRPPPPHQAERRRDPQQERRCSRARVVPQQRPHRRIGLQRLDLGDDRRRRRDLRRPRQRLGRRRHRPRHAVGWLGQRPAQRRRPPRHQQRAQRHH